MELSVKPSSHKYRELKIKEGHVKIDLGLFDKSEWFELAHHLEEVIDLLTENWD